MLNINGYKILDQIFEGSNTLVLRALREIDQIHVLLKIPVPDFSSIKDFSRLNNEFDILKDLEIQGIVKAYELIKFDNNQALVLEDFGGKSFNQIYPFKKLKLKDFLNIACSLSATLGELHDNNIIHQDIKPQNIIINPNTGEIKITDFCLSTRYMGESQEIFNINKSLGTISYMSPEQTGRMNRVIDFRTDLYSLGVTFYEMLTGRLPFDFKDPMEIVHSHIARFPISPCKINSEIPEVLSKIIMKLLSKNAEDRYNTSEALHFDLEKCRDRLNINGIIEDFNIAENNVSDRFSLSQKLYGRNKEIALLFEAFEEACLGNIKIFFVTGSSGIGKSRLVHEIHKPVIKNRGYFISGKYNKFNQNIPYSSLIEAFQDIIQQILTENTSRIESWKNKILSAIGENGGIITEVIPEVELIIGKQNKVELMEPAETKNRFNTVFLNFFSVFAKKEHPLVIFLDDLQWCDTASLNFIENLLTGFSKLHLLLIGSYRENEVESSHPLSLFLSEIQNTSKFTIKRIELQPLNLQDVNAFVSETLFRNLHETHDLSERLMEKTNGNPFFINQFLKSIHDNNFLFFNRKAGAWEWDLTGIASMDITDNVVKLLIQRIGDLPDESQKILKFASCIGNRFKLKTLSHLLEISRKALITYLIPSYEKGLLIQMNTACRFPHDHIRQAAYSLLTEDNKKNNHLKIGLALLSDIEIQNNDLHDFIPNELLFDIAKHLNEAKELITEKKIINNLVQINLKAAKNAKSSAAFETALHLFREASEISEEIIWDENYNLALDINIEILECEYLCGNFTRAEELSNYLLGRVSSAVDTTRIYRIQIVQNTNLNKWTGAIDIGIKGLKLFGLDYSNINIQQAIESEFNICKNLLNGREIKDLVNLKEMSDPEQKIILDILINMISPIYISRPDMLPLILLKMLNTSLTYGNYGVSSAYAYEGYGIFLGSVFGDYKTGYEFGKVAIKLTEKTNSLKLKCQLLSSFCINLQPWNKPLESCLANSLEAYKTGIQSGDLLWAGYIISARIIFMFSMGKELLTVLKEIKIYLHFLEQTKNPMLIFVLIIQQMILNLQGKLTNKFKLDGDNFSEISVWENLKNSSFHHGIHYLSLCRMIILYLYGDHAKALEAAKDSESSLAGAIGQFSVAEHCFYHSLIICSLYPDATDEDKNKYQEILNENVRKLEVWSDNCPENFQNMLLLVKAEMSGLARDDLAAMDLYDRAIQSALKNNFIQIAAIANECAAKFYLSRGKEFIAKAYLKESIQCYLLWGAYAKVDEINEKYQGFLLKTSKPSRSDSSSSSSNAGENLDLSAILKSSQSISEELNLNKLIEKLIKIVLENAGADRVLFIFKRNEDLFIEAECRIDSNSEILKSIPVESYDDLPVGIIHYVNRTLEDVVINDTSQENKFESALTSSRNKVKSILCMPIIKQNQLYGILYLENSLATDVFTLKRMNTLKLLSAQAAISLENAIYLKQMKKEISKTKNAESALKQSEERYALSIKGANDGLWDWDLIGGEIYYSPRWKSMLGYSDNEIGNSSDEWFKRTHPDDLENLEAKIQDHLSGKIPHFEIEHRMLHKNGSYKWVLTRGLAIENVEGKYYRMAGSQSDITKRKLAEEQLKHDALHDALTGLPNWNLFMERLSRAIKKSNREKDLIFAVLFLDIDRFKLINDSLGHLTGNRLLVDFSKKLQNVLRPDDIIARFGGDEFAILVDNIGDISDVIHLVHRIHEQLVQPFVLQNQEFIITASTGIVLYREDYEKPEDILRDADTAMYRAKSSGRNKYEIFDKTMHAQAMSFLRIENDLRSALENNEFELYYQPIISLNDRTMMSCEVLLRWNHKQRGLVLPGEFISVAEEAGLIELIGDWVLNTACAQNKIWQRDCNAFFPVSVNISAHQFLKNRLLRTIDQNLQKFQLDSKYLKIEITESVLMHDINTAVILLEELKLMGVGIYIDDFGTGYSSLSYLQRFPIDTLKIDRSFVQNISENLNDAAIARAIIAMGHSLQMKIIAEGIEKEEQLKFFNELLCDGIQGYYLSHPLSADTLTVLLKSSKHPTF